MIRRRESGWVEEHGPGKLALHPPEPIICWVESDHSDRGRVRRTRGNTALLLGLAGVFLLVGVAAADRGLRARTETPRAAVVRTCSDVREWIRISELLEAHRQAIGGRGPRTGAYLLGSVAN